MFCIQMLLEEVRGLYKMVLTCKVGCHGNGLTVKQSLIASNQSSIRNRVGSKNSGNIRNVLNRALGRVKSRCLSRKYSIIRWKKNTEFVYCLHLESGFDYR